MFHTYVSIHSCLACKRSRSDGDMRCDSSRVRKFPFAGRCAWRVAHTVQITCFHLLKFCVRPAAGNNFRANARKTVARTMACPRERTDKKTASYDLFAILSAKRNENKSFRFGRYVVPLTNGKYSSVEFNFGACRHVIFPFQLVHLFIYFICVGWNGRTTSIYWKVYLYHVRSKVWRTRVQCAQCALSHRHNLSLFTWIECTKLRTAPLPSSHTNIARQIPYIWSATHTDECNKFFGRHYANITVWNVYDMRNEMGNNINSEAIQKINT